jgi:D-alanyl-D-alanine dipeptidase
VANPNKGYSSHSRGNTLDVTLVNAEGREVEMPTAFDDFSSLADREYSDCTADAANHAELLEILMEKHGFSAYFGEWWHYSDTTSYPVELVFEP